MAGWPRLKEFPVGSAIFIGAGRWQGIVFEVLAGRKWTTVGYVRAIKNVVTLATEWVNEDNFAKAA